MHLVTVVTQENRLVDEFLARKGEAERLLHAIQSTVSDHLGTHPDRLTWGHVGSMGAIVESLRSVHQFVKGVTP